MTFYSPIELHNYTTEKCNGIHFSFKKLNKRYFYDTFERKLDNDIFVLKNEMCFYLAMLNIHANSQCTFFFFFLVIREGYSLGVNLIYRLLIQNYMNMTFGPFLFFIFLYATIQYKTIPV